MEIQNGTPKMVVVVGRCVWLYWKKLFINLPSKAFDRNTVSCFSLWLQENVHIRLFVCRQGNNRAWHRYSVYQPSTVQLMFWTFSQPRYYFCKEPFINYVMQFWIIPPTVMLFSFNAYLLLLQNYWPLPRPLRPWRHLRTAPKWPKFIWVIISSSYLQVKANC